MDVGLSRDGRALACVWTQPTLVLLGGVVVVDLLPDALALAEVAGQILLLLLVVVAKEFLPVVRIHVLLLLDDLSLHLLLHKHTYNIHLLGQFLVLAFETYFCIF